MQPTTIIFSEDVNQEKSCASNSWLSADILKRRIFDLKIRRTPVSGVLADLQDLIHLIAEGLGERLWYVTTVHCHAEELSVIVLRVFYVPHLTHTTASTGNKHKHT